MLRAIYSGLFIMMFLGPSHTLAASVYDLYTLIGNKPFSALKPEYQRLLSEKNSSVIVGYALGAKDREFFKCVMQSPSKGRHLGKEIFIELYKLVNEMPKAAKEMDAFQAVPIMGAVICEEWGYKVKGLPWN